jgi:hypothetical protein
MRAHALTLVVAVLAGCSGASGTHRPPVGGASGEGGEGEGGSGGLGGRGGAGAGGASGTGGASTGGSGGTPGTGGAGGTGGTAPDAAATSRDAAPSDAPPPAEGCARMVPVSGSAALAGAVTAAMPGDCLILADGAYDPLTITAKGTAAAPIVLRAANRGKVIVSAGNIAMMGAAYVVVEGFSFQGMSSAVATSSDHCRISRCRFQLGVARANGTSDFTRIDHNEFGPKNTGDGHYVHATESSTNSRIDHNYLHDATGGGTSRDSVSLGCCGPEFDYHETGNVMEYNLLVNCSADAEIVSIKSSSNTIRYNTIRRSSGTLTLRAGRKSAIYGNFLFGPGGGGIRMYEDDHKIYNNYVETGTALQGEGDGNGHAVVRRAVIVHNTFVGAVRLAGEGNTFSNNIVIGSASLGGAAAQANLVGGSAPAGLVRKGDVYTATAMGPAVNAAMGSFPFVLDDMQGQLRDKPDIGADEWSTDPEMAERRPLTPADVGPDAP